VEFFFPALLKRKRGGKKINVFFHRMEKKEAKKEKKKKKGWLCNRRKEEGKTVRRNLSRGRKGKKVGRGVAKLLAHNRREENPVYLENGGEEKRVHKSANLC